MKIVAIKDMSAGNETVGEMWKETKTFDHDARLIDVMKWVGMKKNVVLSIPDDYNGGEEDFLSGDISGDF